MAICQPTVKCNGCNLEMQLATLSAPPSRKRVAATRTAEGLSHVGRQMQTLDLCMLRELCPCVRAIWNTLTATALLQ